MLLSDRNIQHHSGEIQDIITAPPAWLLRRGIVLFFGILFSIVIASAFIRYPDIVNSQLKIITAVTPKAVVSKISGKVIAILKFENEKVDSGQVLAYLESTASHQQVLTLLTDLKNMQQCIFVQHKILPMFLNLPHQLQLGEMQMSYQNFFQAYLMYKSSVDGGIYVKKMEFLSKDLADIQQQKRILLVQNQLQQKEYELAREEFDMHESLFHDKVEAKSEFRKQQNILLEKEYTLQQTAASILLNETNYSNKRREILELDNQIREEKSRFIQALNSIISEIEDWKSRYVLCASTAGTVSIAENIQKDQFINANQGIFYVNPGNVNFIGEMVIPQYNMGKVKKGQRVLIKLKSYPYEEFGLIEGRIKHIADVPYKDSVFVSRVSFDNYLHLRLKNGVDLKNGMLADAEIITEDASILKRVSRNVINMLQ